MTDIVILRYFPAIGRAQPLRHALTDTVGVEDVRIPQPEWPALKNDPGHGGPWGGLPTLTWGSVTIGETLPIAFFVARRLGQYDDLDFADIAHLESVVSAAYIDLMIASGDLVWADGRYAGADMTKVVPTHLRKMLDKAARLDRLLPESGWFGGPHPVVADFFAAEGYEALAYVLGPGRADALRARVPRLAGLAARVRTRPSLAAQWERRPDRRTMRPDEHAAMARMHALDLSSIGL